MGNPKYDIPVGIPDFYKGKSIFVTGFTGYIGKLLVEKLLYSCPELNKIYVLVRAKKDQSPQERAERIMNSLAFNRLREKYPGLLESKVVVLPGDALEERLGLSSENEDLLRKEVSIIFHGAASVRFDDPLRDAIHMNTLGTKKIIDLALTMPKLICLAYISTAYSNCDHIYIKEEMYPPKADWRKTIEICDKLDPAHLQILHPKYIGRMPNTYSFSKSLAEQVINDYRDKLPVVIVRPSIVVSAHKEPIPGWIDNRYGPMGIVIGGFLGLIRCSWVQLKEKCNYIPSDIVVNATITAAWKTAMAYKPETVQESTAVYNVCSPLPFNITHEEFVTIHEKQGEIQEILMKNGLNFHHATLTSRKWLFEINNLYRNVLPSILVDLILVLNKRNPMLLKIRRKIFGAVIALSYFSLRTFEFQTDNADGLVKLMNPRDRETFGWDYDQIDYYKSFATTFILSKQTLLKPLFDDLETNKKRLGMLYFVDRFAVYLTYSLVAFIFYYSSVIQRTLSSTLSFVTLH